MLVGLAEQAWYEVVVHYILLFTNSDLANTKLHITVIKSLFALRLNKITEKITQIIIMIVYSFRNLNSFSNGEPQAGEDKRETDFGFSNHWPEQTWASGLSHIGHASKTPWFEQLPSCDCERRQTNSDCRKKNVLSWQLFATPAPEIRPTILVLHIMSTLNVSSIRLQFGKAFIL